MSANELADVLMFTKFQVDEDGTMIGVSHQAVNEAATMLRQQQAEIETLKSEIVSIEKNTDYWADKANWIKKNKPVAWMDENENVIFEKNWAYPIPLYTHPVKEEAEQQSYQEADGCPTELAVLKRFWRQHNPVKELKNIVVASATCSCGKVMEVTNLQPVKELTDEEILSCLNHLEISESGKKHQIDFARAILRKAQEK